MAYVILLLTLIAVWAWGAGHKRQVRRMQAKLKPIIDVERYAKDARLLAEQQLAVARTEGAGILDAAVKQRLELKLEAENELREAKKKASEVVDSAKKERSDLDLEKETLKRLIESSSSELKTLKEQLLLQSEDAHLLAIGYYEPIYGFEDLPKYEKQMRIIKDLQKEMLRADGALGGRASAAYSTQTLTFNGSEAQGRQLVKKILRLMLRAFNGECDSFISRVTYRNVGVMEQRIKSAFDQINKLADAWSCELSSSFLDLRIQELKLVYEWEEAKQREKEEQARIREQIREEDKAQREIEKAKQQAADEEQKYEELLRKAQDEVTAAADKDKDKLNKQILELQRRIAEIEEQKRTISQAELTKTGHVYIISNVGSFGDDVYKIGMTRRLEPMDRVKELGDASVPFPFDVHAMIRTSNAPSLENALHIHFADRRLNLENQRKEFFRVSIEEIREELSKLKETLGIDSELHLTLMAEAKEYRLSIAKRNHLEEMYQAH